MNLHFWLLFGTVLIGIAILWGAFNLIGHAILRSIRAERVRQELQRENLGNVVRYAPRRRA